MDTLKMVLAFCGDVENMFLYTFMLPSLYTFVLSMPTIFKDK